MKTFAPVLIGAGLLLAACGGATAPASSAPPSSAAPAASVTSAKPVVSAASSAAPASAGAAAKPSAAAPASGLQHIKIGVVGITADSPLYIAQDQGYYKAQGLEAEFITFQTAGDSIQRCRRDR